ncbi:hypothetical protein LWI29_037879 [Acer saccharum]|uniref:Uncharacterized protein n=1 Tax=Acer saccharum TaxID=4024 RepID=A0AA39W9E0_ACESA|nr:hypothetical protein LWI29_037879 [Acer saccharum]
MRSWKNLGVVETIYEEEYEDSCSSSHSSSLTPSSPLANLQSRVEARSVANSCKTDVLIRVNGTGFHLHKDPLTSRSTYLKRQLTDLSDFSLSPPLNITAETFSVLADFCYGAPLVITPFNVAALRTAAELLQMTDTNNGGDENLRHITESYFSQAVSVNQEYALIVFRSCLNLLPEAETTAFLVSRCIEALTLMQEGYGIVNLFEDVITLRPEDLKIVAESMYLRFSSHDVVYEIIDLYLKEHNGKITEEQKTELCSFIDCNKLSSQLLLQAVQNPRMPLRFIIRAMLAEQLNTHRSIFSSTPCHHQHSLLKHHQRNPSDPITLGTILQRDAALREASQLKAAMNATSLRIQNLENELSGMKKILDETEKEKNELNDMNNRLLHEQAEKERNDLINGVKKLLHQTEIERSELNDMNRLLCEPENGKSVLHSGRSVSFHYGKENKVKRGERGSVSSLNVRFPSREERRVLGSSSPEGSCNNGKKKNKNIGQRLISGLKSAFRVSKPSSNKEILSRDMDANKVRDGYEDHEHEHEREGFMVIKEDLPFRLRNITLG